MSSPASPLMPVDRLQVAAAFSPQGMVLYDFRERLDSIDSDLTDTERESERLARKLNKRLSGSHPDLTSPAEYFIERLTKWHSNKKVERLKTLLATHVPRVKHLEENVVSSAVTVHENKEAVTRQAVALLGLVDKQIDYYQHHMNFLDDVINDIRQCDYTLVREITDMKAAFAFYQEVDTRPRTSSRSASGPAVRPCSVLLKLGADSAGVGYVPGRRIFEDDAAVLGFGDVAGDIIAAADSEGSVVVPEMVNAPRCDRRDVGLPSFEAASKNGTNHPSTGRDFTSPSSVDSASFDPVLDNLDGAEYKRKCLKSHAVNLQSLNIDLRAVGKTGASGGAHARSGAHSGDHAQHPRAEPKRASSMSPSMLMRHVSEKLSEMTHLHSKHTHPPHADKEKKKASEGKHRSWSVSSGSTQGATSVESRSGRSSTLPPPLVFDQLHHPDSALRASPSGSLVHSTTPRPSSLGSHSALPHIGGFNLFAHHDSNSAAFTHLHEPSHKVDSGIAFEGATPVQPSPPGAFFAHERQIQHLTAASIMAHGHSHGHGSHPPSHHHHSHGHSHSNAGASSLNGNQHGALVPSVSGQVSTSSSCSNLSASSGAPAASQLDRTERRRLRYAALRNHYPNLYQIANSHGSDPATKLLARRLNKCLMFKDELKRSLVRAEQVQEAENTCLCKMRKVQHELQDVVGDATDPTAGQSSAHSSVCLSLSHCGSPLLSKASPSRPELSHPISGGCSTFLSGLGLHINTDPTAAVNTASTAPGAPSASSDASHSSTDETTAANGTVAGAGAAGGSPSKSSSRYHPVMAHIAHHLSDHDLSSTDDEHDHLTASNTSSQSRDNSFSQLHSDTAATTPRATHGVSGGGAGLQGQHGHSDSGCIEPLQRIPSDPTIIDPSQDAAVNQISYELCEAARQCAQQLRMLQDEEEEATDKLNRVRSLLSKASHIDQELVTKLVAK